MQTRNRLPLNPLLLSLVLAACAVQEPVVRDSIPRQLAEDLANGQITLDFPEGFPEFAMPEDISVQGSLDRGFNMTLVLRSELSEDVMEENIRAELARAGWTELETPSFQPRGGFVGNLSPIQARPSPSQLCHDRYGNMSIGPRNRQGIYNRLGLDWNYNANAPRMTCAQQNEQRQGMVIPRIAARDLNQYMPVLELPEEDRSSRFRPYFGSGTSGSGDALTTSSPLALDWDLDEINRWFADQLEDQGWEHDVSWTGENSAGSTWSKVADDETELAGLLDIIHADGDNYQLRFRLSYKAQ